MSQHNGDRRRRVLRGATAALALGGAALLGSGLLAQQPAPPQPPPDAVAPAPTTTSPARTTANAPRSLTTGPLMNAARPVEITIPSLSVSSPLVDLGLQDDGTMEVPVDGDDAGWYTGAPTPGALGPSVIAGHVDWKGEPGVFYELGDLEPGAEILVRRADDTVAVFAVTTVGQYPKDKFPTNDVYGAINHAGLRLITCGGEFDTTRDSYRDNIVAYATLTDTQT